MGRFLNPDNSAFQSALNANIYVDKSGLLDYTNKVIGSIDAFICNSRPRRFGKSITANMLTAYYSKGCDSKAMFEKLNIGKSESFEMHLNRYDVIHIDLQWCIEPAGGAAGLVTYITKCVVAELRETYADILPETVTSLSEALSYINAAKGTRFVVIIDEWDVLIRDEAHNKVVQEEYISFLRGMFKGTEPTKYIALAYMTGILPIKKYKTQSALNNFEEYYLIHLGYLGYDQKKKKAFIPNEEIRQEFQKALKRKKWNQSAETALEQIKDKQYPESIKEYTGSILLVGISYDKKTKIHECKIERYEKR